jgi:hypothetical protein
MLKYLRIAVTALSLTACVLLIALWVRSYWRFDGIYKLYKNGMSLTLASNNGAILIPDEKQTLFVRYAHQGWKLRSKRAVPIILNAQWMPAPGKPLVVIPHWFPVLLFSTLAAVPWIHWSKRFSLRALLIATTLVAVGLGIVAVSN